MKACKWILVASSALGCVTLHAQDSGSVASLERGKTVYEKVCLSCHQADGSGVPNLTPPLIEGVFVNGEKKTLIGMVLAGMEEVNIKGEYYAGSMPGFDYLSDDEIADVLTFVRSSFKNKAQPISKAEVAAVRTAKKQQKPD